VIPVVKIYENKSNGQVFITVPKAIYKAKGFKSGQELDWVIDNLGNLILKPKG
jgi:hypothetical protein